MKKCVIEKSFNFLEQDTASCLPMDNETKKMFRTLSYLSTVGMAMALSISLGALIGYYLDNRFGTEPWLFFVFLGFGIIAAFKNLMFMVKRSRESDQEK